MSGVGPRPLHEWARLLSSYAEQTLDECDNVPTTLPELLADVELFVELDGDGCDAS